MIRHTGLGLSTFVLASPFSDGDVQAYERTREMGYDLIEVCIEDPSRLSAESIVEHAAATGLQVSICGAFGPARDISSEDASVRESARRYLELCVDYAQAVGSPHVAGPMYATTGVARLLPPEARAAQLQRAADGLRAVADYAAERGVRLAIEPLNRFETDLINTLDQGLQLCDLIGRPNVGLMIDSFHMNIEETSIGDAIRAAGSLVFHVQVSENDRGTPGSGHLPWEDFFAALSDIDYSGQIVVESFLPTVEEIARAVSLWRPVAPSMDALATDGLSFLEAQVRAHAGAPQ
ncbi:MAG: sugar phosphate isomerase [Naasia sp.]|nr:sugar phosphate isomerase [Naasia sp.]